MDQSEIEDRIISIECFLLDYGDALERVGLAGIREMEAELEELRGMKH